MTRPPNAVRDRVTITLASAYYELVTGGAGANDAAELATSAALVLDGDRLRVLCRAVRDPFAWQPFMRQLRAIHHSRRTARTMSAGGRLHALATELLHEQGLALVHPDDLLARPSAFEEGLLALDPNTNI
jgi:hypothetical protein